MSSEQKNTFLNDDDDNLFININDESLCISSENKNNDYTVNDDDTKTKTDIITITDVNSNIKGEHHHPSHNNNNNNTSYISSSIITFDKDLYTSSKDEYNQMIESEINKLLSSSNQSFTSKMSRSIPSRTIKSDDLISTIPTELLFNLDSVTSFDSNSYKEMIKKFMENNGSIDIGSSNEEVYKNNEHDREEEEEEEDVNHNNMDDRNSNENEGKKQKENNGSEESFKKLQIHSISSLDTEYLLNDISTVTSNTLKKDNNNKNRKSFHKAKKDKYEKESHVNTISSVNPTTYSQYSISGLSSISDMTSLSTKSKLLKEIEKLKELNSKLSKTTSYSKSNEQSKESRILIGSESGENLEYSSLDTVDPMTSLFLPDKSEFDMENTTTAEPFTINTKEEHLNESLPTSEYNKAIRKEKSKSEHENEIKNGNRNEIEIEIEIENENENENKIDHVSNNNTEFVTSAKDSLPSSPSISYSELSMDINDFSTLAKYQRYKEQKKILKKKFSKKWKEIKNRLKAKNLKFHTSEISSNHPSHSKRSVTAFSSKDTDTISVIDRNNVIIKHSSTYYSNSIHNIKSIPTTPTTTVSFPSYSNIDMTPTPMTHPFKENSLYPIATIPTIPTTPTTPTIPSTPTITTATTSTTMTNSMTEMDMGLGANILIQSKEPPSHPTLSFSQLPSQLNQSSINVQPMYNEQDSINLYQTHKNDTTSIMDSTLEGKKEEEKNYEVTHPKVYSLLTQQIKELSQENKDKDDKIQHLYEQLQTERKNSELLKSKFRKLKREISRTNEKNQRSLQKYIRQNDEQLYQTEREYMNRIRELEFEIYKERLNNKTLSQTSSNHIKKLNEKLETTTQEYQKNSKEINMKQKIQLDTLYEEFARLKRRMYMEKQEQEDLNLDFIFKMLNEKNTYANNYIDKLMKKIKN
ncbi:hypothetical protein H8356DRAFT_1301721 [Neocallimastix lanati (nom. inval.)]|nr:hypothetical protein H8356DRAFT_1301721 [Neocallimastix sp. JGI-2020a]